MAISIRELPPQRLHHLIETPSGKTYRWAEDEPKAQNVPSGVRFSSAMPGGYESWEGTLPRKSGVSYSDLERLSTITTKTAGGEIVSQTRLERAPRVSGDEQGVSPQGVGYQAALEDDKSAVEVYVDQDPAHWEAPSPTRRLAVLQGNAVLDADYTATTGNGIAFNGVSGQAISSGSRTELHFNPPPGVLPSKVMYLGAERNLTSITAAALYSDDNEAMASAATTSLTLDSTLRTATPTTAERFLMLAAIASATHTPAAGSPFSRELTKLAVYGSSGVTTRTTSATEPDGVFASDVIANVVSRWAPSLNFTTGVDGTIKPTSFVIPHLSFPEETTAAEMVKAANRFHINDWAVWDGPLGPTFYYHPRGDRGRRWRARVAPAQLEETGPAVDRLWNGVVVRYRDVDGTTRTVGPTGAANTNATSADLIDTDPLNPANQKGIRRWLMVDMQKVSTLAGATEVGRRTLVETKELDRSGKARLVGIVEDDRGILRPASQVKAGDGITFVDAADTSERRIVKAEYTHDDRTCSIDLDAPPEGLDALLERLGVVLIPLGA